MAVSFAVDGNSFVHAFWAGTGGQQCAAEQLVRLVDHWRTYKRALAVVYFDPPGPTWRHAIYPEYKAGRPEKDPALVAVLAKSAELCRKAGCHATTYPGYESDDMLAVFTAQETLAGRNVVLCSRDKDLYQLLEPKRVVILKNAKSWRGEWTFEYFNANEFHDEHKLLPTAWPDFRALTGDTSDNWPGAPGIGPVAALKILHHSGTLAAAVETARQRPLALPLNVKQRETLANFDSELGLRLMTLRNTAPEPVGV